MPFLDDLGSALAASADGRAACARALTRLWDSLDHEDRAGRCIVAHYLADQQGDLDTEVEWDEIALASSAGVTDADLQALHPTLTVVGFMPSLHLNLADGYRRQGRFADAAAALDASVADNGALSADTPEQAAYRDLITSAQQRVRIEIEARDTSPHESGGP